MATLLKKNGTIYTMVDESDSEKLRFIFKNLGTEKGDFETRCNLAKCYINHKKLGVIYSKEIMDQIIN